MLFQRFKRTCRSGQATSVLFVTCRNVSDTQQNSPLHVTTSMRNTADFHGLHDFGMRVRMSACTGWNQQTRHSGLDDVAIAKRGPRYNVVLSDKIMHYAQNARIILELFFLATCRTFISHILPATIYASATAKLLLHAFMSSPRPITTILPCVGDAVGAVLPSPLPLAVLLPPASPNSKISLTPCRCITPPSVRTRRPLTR